MKNNRFHRKFLTWVWIFIIAVNGYVAVVSILEGIYNQLLFPVIMLAIAPFMIKIVHYAFRDD